MTRKRPATPSVRSSANFYSFRDRKALAGFVGKSALDDLAPFAPLALTKRGKDIDYEAKTVKLAGRRSIVCRNHQEAEKDAADRASIVAALQRQLAKGDKALMAMPAFSATSRQSARSAL